MIARIWRGWVGTDRAAAYVDDIVGTGIAEYRQTPGNLGAQMLTSVDHLVRGLLRSELAGKLARLPFFWLRYLDRLVPTSFAMDNASAYYFLGRRSERELSPNEIVAYYRGAHRSAPTGD